MWRGAGSFERDREGEGQTTKGYYDCLAVSRVGRGNRLLRVGVGLSAAGLVTIMVSLVFFLPRHHTNQNDQTNLCIRGMWILSEG